LFFVSVVPPSAERAALSFNDFLYDKTRATSEYSPNIANRQLYRAFEILDGQRKESQKLEITVSRIFRLPDLYE
jgi:hypothetical protein